MPAKNNEWKETIPFYKQADQIWASNNGGRGEYAVIAGTVFDRPSYQVKCFGEILPPGFRLVGVKNIVNPASLAQLLRDCHDLPQLASSDSDAVSLLSLRVPASASV